MASRGNWLCRQRQAGGVCVGTLSFVADWQEHRMVELMRTTDPGLVSVVEALLGEAGIPYHVADRNMSALEGAIQAFPQRVLVPEEREAEARSLLGDADLGAWLRR